MGAGDVNKACPRLWIKECECGRPDCGRVNFFVGNPSVRTQREAGLADSDQLVASVSMPVSKVPSLIRALTELCNKRGVSLA